jgi:hypothetical protein
MSDKNLEFLLNNYILFLLKNSLFLQSFFLSS